MFECKTVIKVHNTLTIWFPAFKSVVKQKTGQVSWNIRYKIFVDKSGISYFSMNSNTGLAQHFNGHNGLDVKIFGIHKNIWLLNWFSIALQEYCLEKVS
jgi:hypothetical protein